MEIAPANKDAVNAVLGVNPSREMKSSFNEEELAVVVPYAYGKRRELAGNKKEQENGEPFVLEVIAEPELAMEVGERRFGRADTRR